MNLFLYIFLIIVFKFAGAVYISSKAKENGLDQQEWFIRGLFSIRFGLTSHSLNRAIEQKNKEVIKAKNKYQNAIKEQEAIKKKIEKSRVSFFNSVYNLSIDLRCVDTTITDQQSHLTAYVTAKSYGKGIDSIKAKLCIKDSDGNQFEVEDIVFRKNGNDEEIWISEDTELIISQSISTSDIVEVDVYVKNVIWEDLETEIVDEKQNVLIDNTKNISKLRKIIGEDIVTRYTAGKTDWQCYCGESNNLSVDICQRCARDRRNLPEIGNIDILIGKLSECKTVLEAKELILSLEELLDGELAEKVNKQVEKDIYIKKMYGILDEKKAISKYTEIILEG